MKNILDERYKIYYDQLEQQVNFEGILRPSSMSETVGISTFLKETAKELSGCLKLNFRKLRYINSVGLRTLANYIHHEKDRDQIRLKIIGSTIVDWESKILPNFVKLWETMEFELFDDNFYESQDIIEDSDFVPLLKNQTRLLWPFEKKVLRDHGLKEGMKIADICCGCGDTSLLIAREFNPRSILGIDHSQAGIEHARNLAKDLDINNAGFHMGDATALMLDDELFDYVICRLSIQIFSKPELILKELYRILKPGGRLYLLGEDYDLIVGHPNSQEIKNVYSKAGNYGTDIGMDLYNGKKLYNVFKELKMTDIKVDPIIVGTDEENREMFKAMIESWKKFSVNAIGDSLEIGEEKKKELLEGYSAHLNTISHPDGYTTWGLVAASGQKEG